MATLEQIEQALRAADAAGNTDDAKRLAQAYSDMRKQAQPVANFSNVRDGTDEAQTVAAKAEATRKSEHPIGSALGEIGGRQVLQGAAGLFGSLGGDAINHYVVDPIRRAVHGQTVGGLVSGQNEVAPSPTYREAASNFADSVGMRQPQTASERVMSDVGEGLTGTALTMGTGAIAQRLGGAATQLGNFLTAQPVLQGVSAATGAGASGVTREMGGGQGAQTLAGLVGGMAPGGAAYAGEAGLRGIMRGGESGRQAMQQGISDFRSVGATPSVGQATGNRRTQGIESLLAGAPTSGGVMARTAERQADNIGAGLQKTAEGLYRNASGERAGRAIGRGVNDFTAGFKGKQTELYDHLDAFIPKDQRIDIGNTRSALGSLNAPIAGAPNISRLFQNGKIKGVENALERDLTVPTEAQKSLDEALGRVDELYASRNAATQDAGRFSAFANDQANRIDKFYPVDGQPRFPGRYSPSVQRAEEGARAAGDATGIARGRVSQAKEIESTLGQLQAAADASGGKLPYEAIKKLRTLVGQEIDDAGLLSDFPRSKFKALYGALSEDLGSAASAAGPNARQAWSRANAYTKAGMERLKTIESVIDKNGGPEKVFAAAMSGTRDGGTTLRSVMQSLPPEGQKAVTGAVIKRMGLATAGNQDAGGDVFSAQTFLTNWNKVSPEARKALFDRHGAQFSSDMDKIARVAERIRTGSKVFANPSGTANRAAAFGYLGSLGVAAGTGQAPTVIGLLLSGAATNGMARAMTNPKFVHWLAGQTTAPTGSVAAQIGILSQMGKDDPDIAEVADSLKQGQ